MRASSTAALSPAACMHPTMGKPLRDIVGPAPSIIPSAKKVGGPGTAIDCPLHHKEDVWTFSHFDAMEVALADAPSPSAVPTPLPSVDCAAGTSIYRLTLLDSAGDGWQGASYTVRNSSALAHTNEGAIVGSGMLLNGYSSTEWLCLANGCYELEVTAGSVLGAGLAFSGAALAFFSSSRGFSSKTTSWSSPPTSSTRTSIVAVPRDDFISHP